MTNSMSYLDRSSRAYVSSGKAFCQNGALMEKVLALVEERWISQGSGTIKNCVIMSASNMGDYPLFWYAVKKLAIFTKVLLTKVLVLQVGQAERPRGLAGILLKVVQSTTE